ncbi:MAG: hypothetical protein H7836_02665 [Magnetococcus sp. YQC-3]
MTRMLYTFRWQEGPPTLEQVARHLGLAAEDLDHSFGVVEVEPEQQLCCILVEEEALARCNLLNVSSAQDGCGAFANVRIEPMYYQPPSA